MWWPLAIPLEKGVSELTARSDMEMNGGERGGRTYEEGTGLEFITAEFQPVPRGRVDDASQSASSGAESRVESVSTEKEQWSAGRRTRGMMVAVQVQVVSPPISGGTRLA